jgi:hypothetical protein
MSRVPRASARPIFLAADIQWIDVYWQFYAIAGHREDLTQSPRLFYPRETWTMPKGAIVMTTVDHERHDPRAAAAGAARLETVRDADGSEAFDIFER